MEGFVVDDGNAHLLENSSDLIPHPYDIIVGVCGAGHPRLGIGVLAVLGVGLGGVGVDDEHLGPCLGGLEGEGGPALGHRLQVHGFAGPVEEGNPLGVHIPRAAAGDGFLLDLVGGDLLEFGFGLPFLRMGLGGGVPGP